MSTTAIRNNQMRELRENYEDREQQLKARQDKKLAAQSEKHAAEIERLTDQFTDRFESYKVSTKSKLDDQSKEHLKQVKDIRDLHTRQNRSVKKDHKTTLRQVLDNKEDQINWNKKNYDSRVEDLRDHYQKNRLETAETYEDILAEHKLKQEVALENQREKLQDSHRVELRSARNSNDGRLSQVTKDFKNYRDYADDKYDFLEDKKRMDEKRIVERKRIDMEDLGERYAEREKDLRESFEYEREDIKARHEEKLQNTRNLVYADLRERQMGTLSQMKNRLLSQQRKNERDWISAQKDADRQVANVNRAYQNMSKDYEERERDIIKGMTEAHHEDVRAIHKQNNEVGQLNDQKNRQELAFTKTRLNEAMEYEKSRSEMEIKQKDHLHRRKMLNAQQNQQNEISQLKAYYENQLNVIKNDHHEKTQDLRLELVAEREAALRDFQDRYNNNDFSKDQEIAELKSVYEQEIQAMAEKFDKERLDAAQRHKNLMKYESQKNEQALAEVKEQYEGRIANLEYGYKRELDESHNRHSRQMDIAYEQIRSA